MDTANVRENEKDEVQVMPEPVKRRYYRVHIAYLIIILTLKQSLSIALIQKVIPMGLSEEEVEHIYTAYASRHRQAAQYFIQQIRLTAGPILNHEENAPRILSCSRPSWAALRGCSPKSSFCSTERPSRTAAASPSPA